MSSPSFGRYVTAHEDACLNARSLDLTTPWSLPTSKSNMLQQSRGAAVLYGHTTTREPLTISRTARIASEDPLLVQSEYTKNYLRMTLFLRASNLNGAHKGPESSPLLKPCKAHRRIASSAQVLKTPTRPTLRILTHLRTLCTPTFPRAVRLLTPDRAMRTIALTQFRLCGH